MLVYNYAQMCAIGDTGNRLVYVILYLIETFGEIVLLDQIGQHINLDHPVWRRAQVLMAKQFIMDCFMYFLEIKLSGKSDKIIARQEKAFFEKHGRELARIFHEVLYPFSRPCAYRIVP